LIKSEGLNDPTGSVQFEQEGGYFNDGCDQFLVAGFIINPHPFDMQVQFTEANGEGFYVILPTPYPLLVH